ncbi:purine-nucleoside phosphorylase [Lachnoclostridium sp. Marseille-P6806]|uniref:purine-nucleoside phosphorylase n=1 Tax=Lachnoclostridium sp. Marseille-P6806 TaxID=2364793 RepID=UPI001031CA6B|nr:purine-nucleoside phosphorylase [Lachnoclostridium sp. Marseille-P6806]
MSQTVESIVRCIREKTGFVPRVALTLGSGLGDYAGQLRDASEIPYRELPGFPVSTAPGHAGRFLLGYVGEVPVICMQGRVHYYEGYSMDEVVLPVRVMRALGAETLFLTNAAGGIRADYRPGDLAMLTDHISCFVPNPLIGPNDDAEGVRFPDMSHVYEPELQELLMSAARETGVTLKTGVYAQLTGPSFETPAEIRMLRTLGADLAGMSTVVEAITAAYAGMRICGISLVSNLAAGITGQPLSEEEVIEAGREASDRFTRLVTAAVRKM